MKKRRSQSGNVVILILVAVGLFGALAYTFMRGSGQGQGNLTGNQARVAAQELLNFFNSVDKAANKLRSRGCSVDDINFISSKDTGPFISLNTSSTAPVDKSCNVFDAAGGQINRTIMLEDLQILVDQMTYADQAGNINFRLNDVRPGLGSALNDRSINFNYVRPEICKAYNQLLGMKQDLSESDADFGTLTSGKHSYCTLRNSGDKDHYITYTWLAE